MKFFCNEIVGQSHKIKIRCEIVIAKSQKPVSLHTQYKCIPSTILLNCNSHVLTLFEIKCKHGTFYLLIFFAILLYNENKREIRLKKSRTETTKKMKG